MTDATTYCDVNTCTECPRYGDDCDGDKRVEHTDLISRADAIEVVLTYFIPRSHTGERGEHEEDFVRTIFNALPSAETHEIRTETHGVCLISKDDAMGAVQDHFNANGFKGYDDGQKMMDRIKALPSADAVQGEWVDVENEPYCECSVCGAYIDNLDDDYAFCPRCGARMKGGAE